MAMLTMSFFDQEAFGQSQSVSTVIIITIREPDTTTAQTTTPNTLMGGSADGGYETKLAQASDNQIIKSTKNSYTVYERL